MYEIKSPESKGTRYKDWATTGTISKIYFHVYYLVAPYIILVTCNILTKREVLHCTPFYVFAVREARARQIPIGLPENLKNYFQNAMKKPPVSNIFG